MVGVDRVLTESGGKVEKNTVILVEEKGEITSVVEHHAVEHAIAIHKNMHCYEIYRRFARDVAGETRVHIRADWTTAVLATAMVSQNVLATCGAVPFSSQRTGWIPGYCALATATLMR